ncbi:MAG TPA: stage II sporulation protein E [Bacillota bacterium]|nr:stage II sporulation protein E [Bacillota bacterium]
MNKGQASFVYSSPGNVIFVKGMLMVNLLGFLLSRAFVLEGAMPFGTAFFGAALLNRCMALPAFLSVAAGTVSTVGLIESYRYIAAMGLIFLMLRLSGRKKAPDRRRASFAALFSMMGTSAYWMYLTGGYAPMDIFAAGFEALAAAILVYIFDYAFELFPFSEREYLSREQAICAAVTMAIAVSGVGALRVWHISIKTMVAAAATMTAAHSGGAAAGSAAGALLGVTSGLMTTRAAAMVGAFSFAGLLSGTFSELGRAGSILGFIIGSSILNFYIGSSAMPVINMEEMLAASFILALIPGKVLAGLSRIMERELGGVTGPVSYEAKAHEFISVRLKELAGVFSQLSATFEDVSFKEDFLGGSGLNKLYDGVCQRVCKNCSFYRTCWEKEFYTTYQSVFELLGTAEEKGRAELKHMPPPLRKKCIKPDKLLEAVNYLFDLFRINYRWQNKMEDCRNLVSQQLQGMSHVINSLPGEIDIKYSFNEKLEKSISKGLSRQGIRISRVSVLEKPGKGLEVYLDKKSCYGCRECVKKVVPAVSAVTGKKFGKPGYVCSIRDGMCSLKLVEARKFNVTTEVCTVPKADSQVSGDNYTFAELRDNQYLVALSDGMGTGEQASMESSIAVNMLEQLLEVGYDHDMAVRTINSILMLKSPGDSFSTLDVVIIDLYTGEARAIKIGAPPTYIKRGEEVKVIASSSLPMGIIDSIEFHTKKLSVNGDDFIIMVTDGVVDAHGDKGKEEWIADLLRQTGSRNPKEVARIIFERALEYYNGQARDDMTVIVSKVWENR